MITRNNKGQFVKGFNKNYENINYNPNFHIIEKTKCHCGCGGYVSHPKSRPKKFIWGHNGKIFTQTRFLKGCISLMRGKHHSQKTKDKISNSKKGQLHSEKTKLKMSKNSARYWLGKYRSKETKEKISRKNKNHLAWNKGKKLPNFHPVGMLGKKHCEEIKIKISNSQKLRKEQSHLWKGGISSNKEYRKKWQREYYYKKPNKRLSNQTRQSLKRGGGYINKAIIQMVYEDNIKKYGTLTCYLCLKPIEFSQDSLEHKIPLSRGGTNEYSNLAIAHKSCNSKKHNKTEEEFFFKEIKCH